MNKAFLYPAGQFRNPCDVLYHRGQEKRQTSFLQYSSHMWYIHVMLWTISSDNYPPNQPVKFVCCANIPQNINLSKSSAASTYLPYRGLHLVDKTDSVEDNQTILAITWKSFRHSHSWTITAFPPLIFFLYNILICYHK